MRVILAIDNSSYTYTVIKTLEALELPPESMVTVVMVIPEYTLLGGIKLNLLSLTSSVKKEAQQKKAAELLEGPVQLLRRSGLEAERQVHWGNPSEVLIKLSEEYKADLIVMGAKGWNDLPANHIGSVARAVMKNAETSVLLVRQKCDRKCPEPSAGEENTLVGRVLFATDGSKYSDKIITYLLEMPLPQQSRITVATVLQSHGTALIKIPTLDLEINWQLLTDLRENEAKEAVKIVARSSEKFQERGYSTESVIAQGEADETLLSTIKDSEADMVVLGASSLSGFESISMGSVAERVARYAPCSVLIVRPPKE